jgi:hypothetical protein
VTRLVEKEVQEVEEEIRYVYRQQTTAEILSLIDEILCVKDLFTRRLFLLS